MKPQRWLCRAAFACLAVSPLAHAALGGNAQSVQADQLHMQASNTPVAQSLYSSQSLYTVQALTLERGTVVHEYLTTAGVVFAVTWQGTAMPDLPQILGSSFNTAAAALQAYRQQHPGIGPVALTTGSLVIEAAGHMGFFSGRAYLPSAVPSGVVISELQ